MDEKINNIIVPHLINGQVLIDVFENVESGFVRIVVDSESSITLDETATLTKSLKRSNDFLNRYPDGCRIEVTTPGLDSQLEYPFQFKKNINRNIDISYKNNDDVNEIKCKILSADDDKVIVNYNNDNISISYNEIESAKVLVSFK
tara:strand:- start:1348 stop:1785 length:438 start_codon:yes stop_codon:yes gene_type:complete